MADISVTATSVAPVSDAATAYGTAGETLTAGQPVYRDPADSNYFKKCQKDGTVQESLVYGITLNGGARGQPIKVQTGGVINLGAILTVGETYIVSATAGGIAPIADVSTHYVSLLGVALTAANLQMGILNSKTLRA